MEKINPIPGEILCTIGDIIHKHYHNLIEPRPRDVSMEIYIYLCPYLKNPEPDLGRSKLK